MIHELRVLHCVPGRLPALLKRFETDTLRLFEKHGIKQLGFWTVAIGESNNDLFLILQWGSLAEREQKFGAFLVWRPANNFLKAVESESQFFRAKAADKPSKIVKLFAGRDTSRLLTKGFNCSV
jgi:NIPSNAP